jgi:FAD/FMN-containing dehydrogenase
MTSGQKDISRLTASLSGKKYSLPGDAGYDRARTVWNAMIDRRPACIVHCASAEDVADAIRLAKKHGLDISIRGAGHNIAGSAVCDGGLMIDLSAMNAVRIDADKKRAYVGPGATLAEFDAAAQQHGLATPVGINSTTGISGLTLGGGFGWLTRKYGMTIDNLVSAQLVNTNGERLTLSETENPDLFWAIRGGGGNFGVVTQYEYRLHQVGPEILAGLIVFPISQAKQVLQRYREFVSTAPEELNVWVVLRQAPPLPFLPAEVHGKEVIVLPMFYAGDPKVGEKLIAPLRKFGDAHGEHIGAMPYVAWQQAFDPLLTPGARNYWKSHNFTELKDAAIETALEYIMKLPSPECEIFIGLISGAPNRVPENATAYSGRDAKFVMNVHARWQTPDGDQACVGWARKFFDASKPFASGGAYVNFMTADEADRVPAAYGANYQRLASIKKKYDPGNVFRANQNIKA